MGSHKIGFGFVRDTSARCGSPDFDFSLEKNLARYGQSLRNEGYDPPLTEALVGQMRGNIHEIQKKNQAAHTLSVLRSGSEQPKKALLMPVRDQNCLPEKWVRTYDQMPEGANKREARKALLANEQALDIRKRKVKNDVLKRLLELHNTSDNNGLRRLGQKLDR